MFISLFVVLAALTSYLLWPEPRSTMTPNTSNQLANASGQPTDAVVEEPQGINEKTQKEPIQTASKNETQLATPNPENETIGKAAPVDEKASGDRPPAIFKTQTNPAPDPLPYVSEVDSGVTVPAKAGQMRLAPQIDPAAQELGRPRSRSRYRGSSGSACSRGCIGTRPIHRYAYV